MDEHREEGVKMQGTTLEYQMDAALWKEYFAKFVKKGKHIAMILLILAVFAAVELMMILQLRAKGGGTASFIVVAVFTVACVVLFIKLLRGMEAGPQAARYQKKIEQEYNAADPHYYITLEEERLIYGAKEAKWKMAAPYGSILALIQNDTLLCIQVSTAKKPVNVVCPADAIEGGVQTLIDFIREKNPNCKVKQL